MNKARRQVTITAQALSMHGIASLMFDYSGTGDSSGDFADARWQSWIDDLVSSFSWARENGLAVDGIVACRLGCTLAADALARAGLSVGRSVFWQPVENGRQAMTQFLRLRVAASMMEHDSSESVEDLRQRMAGGESLEIAGYALSPGLHNDVESKKLAELLQPSLGSLKVVEVGRTTSDDLSIPAQRIVRAAVGAGIPTSGQRLSGDPYWTSTEIVVNHGLVDATLKHFVEPVA